MAMRPHFEDEDGLEVWLEYEGPKATTIILYQVGTEPMGDDVFRFTEEDWSDFKAEGDRLFNQLKEQRNASAEQEGG